MAKLRASRPGKKLSNMKHPAIASLCSGLMREKRMSARAMARALRIHHSTFQDYLAGRHRPAPHIRVRLALLAGVAAFDTLVHRQMQQCYGKFYERVCERRQQEKDAIQQRMADVAEAAHAMNGAGNSAGCRAEPEAYARLSDEEAHYAGAKLRTQKADLERQRQQAMERLEAQTHYHADDCLAAELARQRLEHSKNILSHVEAHGASQQTSAAIPATAIEMQRKAVARLQKEYDGLQWRVDTISNTAPLFARLAIAEMDAAIRLREEALAMLGDRSIPWLRSHRHPEAGNA